MQHWQRWKHLRGEDVDRVLAKIVRVLSHFITVAANGSGVS